ncbi:hypothetical protein BO71DRAFT_404703 [Aspergillus ellipticus CBS 707.79]|uniref:Uncharacterized protein n=1 Tax=Aspergillus ellipticus CBS 707.79 TaxID=1448320 RepID=A0A319DGX8_9EURO|nr:hypothetical protein BO71DRAFT_404703 [Aspergillus ellipticus CBS 707.79]
MLLEHRAKYTHLSFIDSILTMKGTNLLRMVVANAEARRAELDIHRDQGPAKPEEVKLSDRPLNTVKFAEKRNILHRLVQLDEPEGGQETEELIDYITRTEPGLINSKDAYGQTPVHLAVELRKMGTLRALLHAGHPDVGILDKEMLSAFDLAVRTSQLRWVQAFLGYPGLDLPALNALARPWYTPLLRAMALENWEIVEAMARHPGSVINVRTMRAAIRLMIDLDYERRWFDLIATIPIAR